MHETGAYPRPTRRWVELLRSRDGSPGQLESRDPCGARFFCLSQGTAGVSRRGAANAPFSLSSLRASA